MYQFYSLQVHKAAQVFYLILAIAPFPATAADSDDLSGDLYGRVQKASVEILNDGRLAGSGCVIESQGIVLTAAHVVTTIKRELEVLIPGGKRLPARVMAVDQGHDLALLQLPPSENGYSSLELADKFPQAGKTVLVFGTALFRHGILLKGSVARDGTSFEYVDGHYVEIVHICGLSPAGLSGGPWVDHTGRVIGVQSSAMTVNQSHLGISFAAPLSAVVHLLKTKASVKTPTLGAAFEEIWEQDPTFLNALAPKTRGLVVRQVKPKGPASAAGLQDFQIITHVDGRPLETRDALLRHIRSKPPGEQITLSITDRTGRNGSEVVVGRRNL